MTTTENTPDWDALYKRIRANVAYSGRTLQPADQEEVVQCVAADLHTKLQAGKEVNLSNLCRWAVSRYRRGVLRSRADCTYSIDAAEVGMDERRKRQFREATTVYPEEVADHSWFDAITEGLYAPHRSMLYQYFILDLPAEQVAQTHGVSKHRVWKIASRHRVLIQEKFLERHHKQTG